MVLIEAGYKDKEMKDIGKKAQTVHNHLIALKKVSWLVLAILLILLRTFTDMPMYSNHGNAS